MPLYFPGDLTGIYYVNDSDGDTFIFNEKKSHSGEVTLKQRISPKKGSLVLFDANHLHAGNNPIDNYSRVVVNINVTLIENFQKHYDGLVSSPR